MNLQQPNANDATRSANRSRDVAPQSGLCSRCVDVGTQYGWEVKVKMSAPVFTGALGASEIARKNWDHFAIGAALSGITVVCGESVCAMDPLLQLGEDGRIELAPDLDHRIRSYRRYHRGQGEILVQVNAEDVKLGVAEYLLEKHGLDTIELKWGQGAKSIGGEVKIDNLQRAIELKRRGYVVTPDPDNFVVQRAFREGTIREFERHTPMRFVDEESFLARCERLRRLGFKRITLKTGAFGLRELAMALRWGSEAQVDLLTIDGAAGGAGMSPWRMMEEWGMPTLYLHSAAVQFAARLAAKGRRVPDMALAGGFSTEDHVFKSLALGSPFVKAVCMGRAMMIPGMVGKNVERWLRNGGLPKSVRQYGETPEQVFACWQQVADIVGRSEMKNVPLGAVGVFSYVENLSVGLQQLMAGARCFQVDAIRRSDLMSLTRECTDVTGIPYVMDAYRDEAEAILDA